MQLTAIGRAALISREGTVLKAYKDSVGIWTIGVGHTSKAGPPKVTPGLSITAAEADELFAVDVVKYANAVAAAVKVPLADHRADALISLCYNIGPAAFSGSTIVKRLNKGDYTGAAEAILMWNKPAEIISRRQAEYDQFRTPYSKSLPRGRRGDKSPVKAPAAPTAPAGVEKPKRPPVLSKGVQNVDAVKVLQQALATKGFYSGKVDGDFGPQTKRGVEGLQKLAGLVADGIVGAETWKVLLDPNAVFGAQPEPAPAAPVTVPISAPASSVEPGFWRSLINLVIANWRR